MTKVHLERDESDYSSRHRELPSFCSDSKSTTFGLRLVPNHYVKWCRLHWLWCKGSCMRDQSYRKRHWALWDSWQPPARPAAFSELPEQELAPHQDWLPVTSAVIKTLGEMFLCWIGQLVSRLHVWCYTDFNNEAGIIHKLYLFSILKYS